MATRRSAREGSSHECLRPDWSDGCGARTRERRIGACPTDNELRARGDDRSCTGTSVACDGASGYCPRIARGLTKLIADQKGSRRQRPEGASPGSGADARAIAETPRGSTARQEPEPTPIAPPTATQSRPHNYYPTMRSGRTAQQPVTLSTTRTGGSGMSGGGGVCVGGGGASMAGAAGGHPR